MSLCYDTNIGDIPFLVQSKFIDVATFTRIPNLSNSASNLAQLRKTEEQAKQKQAELEAQRKATELALAQATQAAQEQVKLEAQLAAQQQTTKPPVAGSHLTSGNISALSTTRISG